MPNSIELVYPLQSLHGMQSAIALPTGEPTQGDDKSGIMGGSSLGWVGGSTESGRQGGPSRVDEPVTRSKYYCRPLSQSGPPAPGPPSAGPRAELAAPTVRVPARSGSLVQHFYIQIRGGTAALRRGKLTVQVEPGPYGMIGRCQ
eukprot:754072-Hanusia_phi.AAC.3